MNERSFISEVILTPDPEHGDGTPATILAAAQTLFLRQGYHGTSMRDIATAAGIVPGAIYNHFASKEGLYLTVLRSANPYRAMGEALQGAAGDTAETLLRDGAHRLVTALQQNSGTVPLIFLDALEFEARNITALMAESFAVFAAYFSRVIRLGAATGELKENRPDILARSFLGLFFSYFITTRFLGRVVSQYPGLDVHANAVDDLVDIYIHGALRAPKGE